jgi:hypothetical protein
MDNSSFVLSSPAGWNYGQPEPPQEVAFDSELAIEFERYLTTESTNSSVGVTAVVGTLDVYRCRHTSFTVVVMEREFF